MNNASQETSCPNYPFALNQSWDFQTSDDVVNHKYSPLSSQTDKIIDTVLEVADVHSSVRRRGSSVEPVWSIANQIQPAHRGKHSLSHERLSFHLVTRLDAPVEPAIIALSSLVG